jgi:hypothetical protein
MDAQIRSLDASFYREPTDCGYREMLTLDQPGMPGLRSMGGSGKAEGFADGERADHRQTAFAAATRL